MKYRAAYQGKTFDRTSHRHYTHAVIPIYTTRVQWVPSSTHNGLSVREEEPCEPYLGTPQFCGSFTLAQRAARPGWAIVEVRRAS